MGGFVAKNAGKGGMFSVVRNSLTYLRGLRCPQREHDDGSRRKRGDFGEGNTLSVEGRVKKSKNKQERRVVVSECREGGEREREERKTEKTGSGSSGVFPGGFSVVTAIRADLIWCRITSTSSAGEFRAAKPEMAD